MRSLTTFKVAISVIALSALAGGSLASEIEKTCEIPNSDTESLELLVCEPPSDVVTQATGPESIALSWQPGASETTWEVQFGDVGFDPLAEEGTIVPSNESVNFGISGLTAETTYEIYVRSVCESPTEFSDWIGPFEVSTACAPVSLDYLQGFENVLPLCWNEAGDGNPSTGPELLGESEWIDDEFMGNNSSDAIRLHLSSNVDREWLLSPFVTIDTDELCEVSFDFGVKEFLGSESSLGSDDEVQLLVRAAGETSWVNIATWDSSFESPADGQNFSFDITSYVGQTLQFAIWATDGLVVDPENNKVFIDNFQVKKVSTCPAVANISTTAIDPYSASFTWQTQGEENSWKVLLGPPGFDPLMGEGEEYLVSGTPEISFDNFSPGDSYEIYVQAICIDGEDYSEWSGPFSFATPCGVEFPEYLQDFTFFVPNCWVKAANGTPDLGPSQFGAGGWVSDFYMENTSTDAARLMLNSNTSQEWLISPQIELTSGTEFQLDFDFGILFADDQSPGNLGADDEFHILISLDDGDSWTTLSTVDDSYSSEEGGEMLEFNLSAYEGETVRFALWGTDGDVIDTPARTIYVDNFRIREVPTCPEPADLTYNNVSITSTNLSWEVAGVEDQWTVSYGPPGYDPNGEAGTEVIANTNSNFQLTGLTTSTPYDVYVRAECIPGEDVSLWEGPVSFETLCQSSPVTEYPFYEDFDNELPPAIPCGWWEENTNGDSFSWETNSIYGNSEPNALFIRVNDVQFVEMNDWVFSPELVMSSTQTYTLTFKYKTGGSNFSENLGVFLCETDDSESVISEIVVLEGISNFEYQTAQVTFQVDADASYHVGFHGYSGVGEFYIALDDVRVCDIPPADEQLDAEVIESLPNVLQGDFHECFSDNFGGSDPDKFYTFTAPDCADSVDVSLCNSDFDTRLSILDTQGNVLDMNDNTQSCGLQSACYGVEVNPGEQYTIVIEGVGGATGNYELAVDLYQTFEDPDFSFEASAFCIDQLLATPDILGTEGGVFTGSEGLVIDPETGEIDLGATGAGVFSVTYTTSEGPCGASETEDIEILSNPSAVFSFPYDTLCVYNDTVLPDIEGAPGGEFSSDSGLNIDLITGEIDPTQSEVGVYQITYDVTVEGCSATSQQQVVIDLCTGVGEEPEMNFTFYPNPTKQEIFVTVGHTEGELRLELYDLTGKLLMKRELLSKSEQRINLPLLAEGVYLLKIKGRKMIIAKKMLIER